MSVAASTVMQQVYSVNHQVFLKTVVVMGLAILASEEKLECYFCEVALQYILKILAFVSLLDF